MEGRSWSPDLWQKLRPLLTKGYELAESAIRKLDQLATEEKENKAIMASRPKIAFETFSGDVSKYPTFLANQEQIFEMFYDANAPDKGASQQLYQLSKIQAPDLARTVLSFSGAQDSAQKAKKWLSLKYKSPKIMIPLVYQEVKDRSPARSETEVPRVAERVLIKIESLSALTKDDNSVLPSDVVQAVFRALFLTREEKMEVLPYLSQGTMILAVQLYIANRFQQYELMTSTSPSLSKSKDSKHPRSNNTNTELLAGAATTTVDSGADGADGKGGGQGGRGQGGGGRGGQRRWPDSGRTSNNNSDGRPPGGKQGVKSCPFCVAKRRPNTAHGIGSCPWISCANNSNLQTALPNI